MFWDVIPESASGKLAVDIMTPHYGDYYQGDATPHDSGQPNPILFLTIPPGSCFEFFVQCDPAALPASLKNSWPILLKAAFQLAFEWLGFGAKTAVGYGAMQLDEEAESRRVEAQQKREDEVAKAAMTMEQRAIDELNGWFNEDKQASKKEPGGRLANRLNELLKEALPWPVEERKDLAKLAEEIYGYLGWGNSKKKQERKSRIRKLMEGSP